MRDEDVGTYRPGPGAKHTALYKTEFLGEADSQQIKQEVFKIQQSWVWWRMRRAECPGGLRGTRVEPRLEALEAEPKSLWL